MKRFGLILLCLALVFAGVIAYHFYDEQSRLASEKTASDEEIERISSEIADLENEIGKISSEMANLEAAALEAVLAALGIVDITPESVAGTIPGSITDDLGRIVTIDEIPQRILSLAPSCTEILFALDLGDRVVGVTDYCDYPEEAKAKPKVGAPFPGFSMETIVDLDPDLVLSIAGTIVGQLENLGLTVVVLQPKDIGDVLRDIALVGGITHKGEKAKTLIDEMEERLAAIVIETAMATERPTVFYEVDASLNENKPYTVGFGTFQDDLITLAGGRNIASGRSGWYEMSIEEILNANPGLIILEDYQYGATPEVVANRSAWKGLTAVKEGRIYPIIDSNLTCRPGPRIVDGLEEIARIIHPELFEE